MGSGAQVASQLAQQPGAKVHWIAVLRRMVQTGSIKPMQAEDLRSAVLLGRAPEVSRASARVALALEEHDDRGARAWTEALTIAVRDVADGPALEEAVRRQHASGNGAGAPGERDGQPSAPPAPTPRADYGPGGAVHFDSSSGGAVPPSRRAVAASESADGSRGDSGSDSESDLVSRSPVLALLDAAGINPQIAALLAARQVLRTQGFAGPGEGDSESEQGGPS